MIQNGSGTSNFYGTDVQNSVRILVSVGGVITDNYSYKAFGEEASISGPSTNWLRYVGGLGYYRDLATRQYVRARHLRTDLGRLIGGLGPESGSNRTVSPYLAFNAPLSGISLVPCPIGSDNCYTHTCCDLYVSLATRRARYAKYAPIINAAIQPFTTCLTGIPYTASTVTTAFQQVMLCVAEGESGLDEHCVATGMGSNIAKGLFQLDRVQFHDCGSGSSICDATADVNAAIEIVINQCQKIPVTIDQAIYNYWQAYRNGTNQLYKQCVKDNGFNDDFNQTVLEWTTCCNCATMPNCENPV